MKYGGWRFEPGGHRPVRDVERLDRIFRELRPEIVFHAAAHKHVPADGAFPAWNAEE